MNDRQEHQEIEASVMALGAAFAALMIGLILLLLA